MNKKGSIFQNRIISYTVLFIILTVVCRLSFIRRGILPIYSVDGIGQYYPVFLYIGQTIREFFTDFTFRFYDLTVGMGEDLIGTLNYYGFGDPVNLLAVFATKTTGPYVFTLSYFLRLYLGGLCFMLYCKKFRLDDIPVVVGALSYVFFGYAVYASGMYIQYASMLYVFPMLLLGCEELLRGGKKFYILAGAAWYLGLCGFYFTYICALFLPVYCIVRSYFICGRSDITGIFRNCMKCAGAFVLGIAVSAPVFIPSFIGFTSSERSGFDPIGALTTVSNYIPDLSRRFVSDANIMNAVRNYAVLLVAAGSFFVPSSKRIMQIRIAVVSLLILLYLPITGVVFNGLADPRDRWVFGAQFVLCVAFVAVLDGLKEDRYRRIYGAALILALFNIVISFWTRYSSLGDDKKSMYITAHEAVAETSSVVDASDIVRSDADLFRISGDFVSEINERPLNAGMVSGFAGTTYWFSMVNGNTQKYVDEATGKTNDWRSFGLGKSNAYETAAAVKYHFTRSDTAPEGFDLIGQTEYADETWNVFENGRYSGFAYYTDEKGDIIPSDINSDYDKNVITCTVASDIPAEASALTVAVPYSDGWKAYVDGRQVMISNRGCFTAIAPGELKKGSSVVLKYTSYGFWPGAGVSACAILVFVILMFYGRRIEKVGKNDTGK